MTTQTSFAVRLHLGGVLFAGGFAAVSITSAQSVPPAPVSAPAAVAPATEAEEDVVVLSPFQVEASTDDVGYYAANTLSGTRLNTRIEDLASSLTVVTKQQMEDFALLDVNDIFLYEASTESAATFTDFEIDRNGMVIDRVQNNPQGANRIRGMSAANIALGNFATSGRVPIDPIAIDAVEISRGPNSNIFGLGEGSGTVNMILSTANFDRPSTRFEARMDHLGGYRTAVDINRPLIAGVLGLRASFVDQHDAYTREPAGGDTRRFNLMLRAQPFKNTSIRASFQSYRYDGTRPNSITPRDAVSYWKSLGSPTWDPITSTMTLNGVSTFMGTTNPTGLQQSSSAARPSLYIDRSGIDLWIVNRMPANTVNVGGVPTVVDETIAPNNIGGAQRMLETAGEPTRSGARPLFSTWPGISDRSVYDWERINLGSINTINDDADTTTIEFEQFVLNNERHKLAFQLAWQREDTDRVNRNVIGQASATGQSGFLYVDVNERLLDGRPNPYFGRPFLGVNEPTTSSDPLVRNSYRGQLAYILDFTRKEGWSRWLGRHQLVAYGEHRQTDTQRFRFRDVVLSDHPYNTGRPKANQSGTAGSVSGRGYFHYYVGDAQDQNIDYAPGDFEHGQYHFTWFNPSINQWVADLVTLGQSAVQEGSGGSSNRRNVIKTQGAVLQSYLLNIGGFDRVVATVGRRKDKDYNKSGPPAVLLPDFYTFDYAAMDGYIGDWRFRDGDTETKGIVVKPLRWLNLHYNESDSFRPEAPAQSITLEELPNPTSVGEDYGLSVNLFEGKLVVRANRYKTSQVNSRAGQSAIFATRTLRIDFQATGDNDPFQLEREATEWTQELHPEWTPEQVDAEVTQIMGLTPDELSQFRNLPISETSDVISEGDEIELYFNPDSLWTVKLNVARNQTVDSKLSPHILEWVNRRLPVWQQVIDPRANNGLGAPWFTTQYGNNTPEGFLNGVVINPLKIVQANEGKSRPQIREWRVNVSTNLRLAKFTENRFLKNMNVGGAIRWEDKGAIGYWGIPVNGDYAAATELDPNRPIYDKSHAYVDLFLAYTTRIYDDKVRARFQFNVRNLNESGRLQPTGAYPDGRPHTFRIIDPRVFIFTATFDI